MGIMKYIDTLIRGIRTRNELNDLIEDMSTLSMKSLSAYAEAFYNYACISINDPKSLLNDEILKYYKKIGYIEDDEIISIMDIVEHAMRRE